VASAAGALRRWSHRSDYALYEKYEDATMIPRDLFADNVRLCRGAAAPGVIVECGCWRGGMSAAMADARPGSRSYLFDSFAGLPATGPLDGTSDFELEAQGKLAAPEEAADQSMARSTSGDYTIVKGWFADTLPKFAAAQEQIAILRIDGDWYDSTMTALECLFPLVVERGLVIIDDYGSWDGCTRAVHTFLSRENRTEPIRRTFCGVPYLRKRGA
jgi:O-methyltransferase